MTYEDPFSAASAVSWFNGKEFKGAAPCSTALPAMQVRVQNPLLGFPPPKSTTHLFCHTGSTIKVTLAEKKEEDFSRGCAYSFMGTGMPYHTFTMSNSRLRPCSQLPMDE